jgi:hypothetical protein
MLRAEKLPDKYLIPEDHLSSADLDLDVAYIDPAQPDGESGPGSVPAPSSSSS